MIHWYRGVGRVVEVCVCGGGGGLNAIGNNHSEGPNDFSDMYKGMVGCDQINTLDV